MVRFDVREKGSAIKNCTFVGGILLTSALMSYIPSILYIPTHFDAKVDEAGQSPFETSTLTWATMFRMG